MGLEDLRRRPTQQLSFGQKKRVSLAGALAMKPKVLIMDEPTAGLDSEMVHELMELSDELNHSGMTLILSTHDIETAYEWADVMVVMFKGELLFSGSPEELFAEHELVDKLRIVPPFPVRLNQQMHFRTRRPEMPLPRNMVEVCQKCFPNHQEPDEVTARPVGPGRIISTTTSPSGGTMFILDVGAADFQEQVLAISDRVQDLHLSSGAYGAKARRMVREGKIDVHHPFHALENAFLHVGLGKDYIMFTDSALISLLGSNLAKVEQKVGLKIDVEFCGEGKPGRTNKPTASKGDPKGEPFRIE